MKLSVRYLNILKLGTNCTIRCSFGYVVAQTVLATIVIIFGSSVKCKDHAANVLILCWRCMHHLVPYITLIVTLGALRQQLSIFGNMGMRL